jgi:hypothetical protein
MYSAAARTSMALALAAWAAGCGAPAEVPEPGAVLLRVKVKPGAPLPDELRVSVYDDSGALWRDVRFPEQGSLSPKGSGQLGTILIQPGTTLGALRVHLRGWTAGTRVLDGLLRIANKDRARGSFDVMLDDAEPADADADGVPDEIDDCAAIANAAQGGCPGSGEDAGTSRDAASDVVIDAGDDAAGMVIDAAVDAGTGADASNGADAGTGADAGNDAGPACGFAGGCNLPRGATCSNDEQCASSFCVDRVCCADACAGKCRACNQPGNDGVCLGYAAMTDPELECASGMTCNGAGACGAASTPGNKARGEICSAASECGSGFCKDGVCCNSACNKACESCSTGTCTTVTRNQDAPECLAPLHCNPSGKCVGS